MAYNIEASYRRHNCLVNVQYSLHYLAICLDHNLIIFKPLSKLGSTVIQLPCVSDSYRSFKSLFAEHGACYFHLLLMVVKCDKLYVLKYL